MTPSNPRPPPSVLVIGDDQGVREVNRELAALKRAYNLGLRDERITRRPPITLLRENNTRRGFFEPTEFETLRAALAEPLRPVVTFAYITGWRIPDEVLTLTWDQVNFDAGTVRLEPQTTKNDDGRTFIMTPALRACLEAQHAVRNGATVFHRAGRPIRDFRRAWQTACEEAQLIGRIPHVPSHSRPQPRARRRAAVGGHEDDRAQD